MPKQKELTQTSGSSCEDRVSGNDRKPAEYGTEAAAQFLALKWQYRGEPSVDVKSWELRADTCTTGGGYSEQWESWGAQGKS